MQHQKIRICMEVETLLPNEPNNFDLIATALTILKQKKLNVINHVLKILVKWMMIMKLTHSHEVHGEFIKLEMMLLE